MSRLTKLLVATSLATVMVFATAAVALAVPTLALTSTKAVVTYPHTTSLKIVSADGTVSVPATVTVQYRTVGSDTWKYLRRISAARTGEGTVTVPVSHTYLKTNTAFRAVADGLESDVATVSVMARLSAATAPASVKARRTITVKGFIWPRHAVGTHPVVVTFWKWEANAWVLKDSVNPPIVGKTVDGSKWQFTRLIGADDKGKWRMQVSHEDGKHAASVSRYSYLRVR